MFDYKIKCQKVSTNIEADMLSWLSGSEHAFHDLHLLDSQEIKEIQQNVTIADKKLIEINDDVRIKEKCLYKIAVPISLRLPLLMEIHTQFGDPGI